MLTVEICLAVFALGIFTFAAADIAAKKGNTVITRGPAILGLAGSIAGMVGSLPAIARLGGISALWQSDAPQAIAHAMWLLGSLWLAASTLRVLVKKKWLLRLRRVLP